MPPRAPFYNLLDGSVIIARTHIESVEVRSELRLHILVLIIHNLVELLHQLDISGVQEIGLLQFCVVKERSVPLRHLNIEKLQKTNDLMLFRLYLLFEQDHH